MSALDIATQMTVEEFLALPGSTGRLERMELVHGEIIMSPMPLFDHQLVLLRLGHLLSERVGTEGWAVCEKEVVVHTPDGEEQVRVPDICYIRKAKADIIGQDAIRGAPDIVIEILSESTQEVDRFTKRAEYGASGVLEYWVVDIPSRAVLVHDFQRGSRRLFKKSFESGVLKSLGLPCRFSVPEIFENLP